MNNPQLLLEDILKLKKRFGISGDETDETAPWVGGNARRVSVISENAKGVQGSRDQNTR
jgi:hypothetical protein